MTIGLAFIVGLLLGAAILYVLQQGKVSSKEVALQQSRRQLDSSEREYQERLNEVTRQLQSDFDTQLAEKIERYQDQHAQQLADLEAEYETRINVFDSLHESAISGYAPEVADNDGMEPMSDDIANETVADTAYEEVTPTPIAEGFIGGVAAATESAVNAMAAVLPDPWHDSASAPAVEVAEVPITSARSASVTATVQAAAQAQVSSPTQQLAESLGQMAALNVQAALKAIPQLGKLSQDADPATRLTAVQA
jgi:uncharacterized membrane-anchored protein YhcB (DUF1043 family)